MIATQIAIYVFRMIMSGVTAHDAVHGFLRSLSDCLNMFIQTSAVRCYTMIVKSTFLRTKAKFILLLWI